MSWWTDIRDTITAPVRAGWEIVTAPFDIAASVVRGDNVFDIIKAQVSEIANPAISAVMPVVGLAGTDSGQKLLENPLLDKLTLGVSSDFKGYAHGLQTLSKDFEISKDDALSSLRLGVKAAVAVGTAGAAGALGIGANTALTGVGVIGGLARGDASGLAAAIGIPEGVLDAAETVNNYFPNQPAAPPATVPTPWNPAPYVSEQPSSQSGYGLRAPASSPSSSSSATPVLLLGAAGVALLVLSRKKS